MTAHQLSNPQSINNFEHCRDIHIIAFLNMDQSLLGHATQHRRHILSQCRVVSGFFNE